MMASSTSAPMAMAMPPRLMVFSSYPNAQSTMMLAIRDNGMANTEINVVRQFMRNNNRTSVTKKAPSNKVRWRLLMLASMKSDCRNTSERRETP